MIKIEGKNVTAKGNEMELLDDVGNFYMAIEMSESLMACSALASMAMFEYKIKHDGKVDFTKKEEQEEFKKLILSKIDEAYEAFEEDEEEEEEHVLS